MSTVEVRVPDIGDFKDIPVIEVLVKPGDSIKAEQSLITLESDKATMDVPSPATGRVDEVLVAAGDKVSEGTLVLKLQTDAGVEPVALPVHGTSDGASGVTGGGAKESKDGAGDGASGGAHDTESAAGAPSATLRPTATSQSVGGGADDDRAAAGDAAPTTAAEAATGSVTAAAARAQSTGTARSVAAADAGVSGSESSASTTPHASPLVRAFARELGVDLTQVAGTGLNGRILREDVQAFVRTSLSGVRAAAAGASAFPGLLPWPNVDFEKFGPVQRTPLTRIRKIAGANLLRNWLMIPHVTNHDDADITSLEAFRVQVNAENAKSGSGGGAPKLTLLAFLIRTCAAALKAFPDFNASLESGESGEQIVHKLYVHIGFAVDTPGGLVVPVVRDADRKGVLDIAREMGELSMKAREGKLAPPDMQGGTFSITSLGGIGGTYFTPIINAPEVAILGLGRSVLRSVWNGSGFAPRLMLPLSLSWDHRVIDGAAAARFNAYLASALGDLRKTLM